MILTGLSLRNFRAHKNTTLNFSEALNYIVGGNGQGKTSILEAAYYLCTTKSFNSKDVEVLSFNENEFEVIGNIKDITENKLRVYFSVGENRKYFFQNDKIISRAAQLIGKFPVVILTPEDHSITQGAPAERRKFVDSVISQASNTYLNILLDYNKTLKHRSVLLNQLKERYSKQLDTELEAWNEKLIESGSEIINHRKNFLKEFTTYVSESYKRIIDTKESPGIEYLFLNNTETNDIKVEFARIIKEKKEEEIRRAVNLVGPHKDDLDFTLDGLSLKKFASQGQQKSFLLALKLAQFEFIKNKKHTKPLLLLDDVYDKLDEARFKKLIELVSGNEFGQVFITDTHPERIKDLFSFNLIDKKIFLVENGNISEIN